MELRHVRYFLAVAEERNFTRAAARLGMAQPPLSSQIKDLEAEIGVKLFRRLPHGTELTEAGRTFFETARALLHDADAAVCAAQKAGRGESGKLCIGLTGAASLNPVIISSVRRFKRLYPEVELSFAEANSVMLLEGLVESRIDIALLRPTEVTSDVVVTTDLLSEKLVAALPASHPVAQGGQEIDLALLRADPLIILPKASGSCLYDAILQAYADRGLAPSFGPSAPQIVSILSLVSAEAGVALLPESIRHIQIDGVVYRTIATPQTNVRLAIGYHGGRPLRTARNFFDIALESARPFAK